MIEIKKYSNRRLYNKETSSYITQDDIVNLIKENKNFKIIDADNKKDITSAILTQIILDKETSGVNLVPVEFLKQIILYYENNKSNDMFGYLNHMHNFANANDMFTEGFSKMMKFNPFDLTNMYNKGSNTSNKPTNHSAEKKTENNEQLSEEVENLKKQLDELKNRI